MADPLLQGYYSLNSPLNTVNPEDMTEEEGVVADLLPELTLTMSDEDLIDLKRDWIKQWEPYNKRILELQTDNENYWLGNQFSASNEKRKVVDNLIFESLETFLPIATGPKLDPTVESPDRAVADKVRQALVFTSDELAFNLKLKQALRYWALYLLGTVKVGWSVKENDITCAAIRPQKLILDPNATIEGCEYSGYYIGEHLQDRASDLITRFPQKKDFITEKVKDKLGSTLDYILWTTDDYVFWTLEDEVLAKNKNPHWNYETEIPGAMDAMGNPGSPTTQAGKNHFKNKKKPYIFLTFFNLGKQPHDDTNLIQQNIPLQDTINKRLVQIDKNADNANGGLAVSGDAFTEEQAGKAAKAKRAGGVIWVPSGPVQNAVVELNGAQLPNFIYQALIDYRGELRNIFGIRGSSPQGLSGERTVRGKMFMQQQDQARIGGGITTVLEEFSDSVLNWFVQLMYIYYDGTQDSYSQVPLSNSEFKTRLLVSVKENSMIPTDPESKRQEAMQLWSERAIDPITFFDRLGFPNPKDSAKNLFLWLSDPVQLFPELAAQIKPQTETKPPTEAINFKDLPPEGQAQLAAQANIHLDPHVLAAHQAQLQVDKTREMVHKHALDMESQRQQHKHQKELSVKAKQHA